MDLGNMPEITNIGPLRNLGRQKGPLIAPLHERSNCVNNLQKQKITGTSDFLNEITKNKIL